MGEWYCSVMDTTYQIAYGSSMEDVRRLRDRLETLVPHHPLYHTGGYDSAKAYMALTELNRRGQLVYFYTLTGILVGVVGFTIQESLEWWSSSDKKTLIELTVMGFPVPESRGFGRVAAEFLMEFAKYNGCSYIVSGTFLGSNNSYKRVGKEAGYSEIYEYPVYLCHVGGEDENNGDR